jgi:acetolactate synthase-1/2/3 large subunit
MTMTKGEPPAAGAAEPQRRSHVPADGTAGAAAVEQARREMLHEVRDRKRTRIGADALMEALILQGSDTLFSYPGGVILPIYDILGDYPEIRHILVRHEQGGGHAADGYARASGKVGVCMGTSGPGATNLVTAIGTAQLDSVPMVALTGNVPGALLGKDAFQEIDITGITLPMTKHNYLVRNADDIPRVVAEAFYIAKTGRPGPVHIDFTKDALQQETRVEHPSLDEVIAGLPGFRPNFEGHPKQLKTAAREIAQAKRPLILAGHGVLIAEAWDELKALAEKAQIPVAWTLLGIGAIDEEHPLAYGYMGMHGWKHVNRAIQSADLLIAIGMRFDDRVTGSVRTYAPYARIIHADIDPAEIGKNVAVEVPIVGDARNVLHGLAKLVHAVDPASRADYFAQLKEWREESEATSWHGSGGAQSGVLTADLVVERIGDLTDHLATYVADVGQNQMWLARYTKFRRPRSHISSGGLGTMGFAVPAAMGAALGYPEAETWAVCGDGGFQMTSQELMTLAADRIPVKIALLDNKKLGMIRQWQEIVYGGNRARLHQARRGLWHPGVQGQHAQRGGSRHQGRPVGRRARAHLVRDRAGAERVPHDAGGQGPVRPDRDVGAGGMTPDQATAARAHPAHPAHVGQDAPPDRLVPGTGEAQRHVLVVLVMDRPGVLNRVASLMRARNFNIDSLAVSRTDKDHISRMTLTLHGDAVAVEQATKQLYRLIDVLKVQDVTQDQLVEHELALIKVRATDANRGEVITIVELYKGAVVDISAESVIVEAHGTEAEIDALVALLRSYGIKELVRTGATVMLRGAGSIEEALKL